MSTPRPVTLSWPGRATTLDPSRATPPRVRTLFHLPASPGDAAPTPRQLGETALTGVEPRPSAQLYAAAAVDTLDHLLATGHGGTVDLVHLDPPFGSEATYDRRVTLTLDDGAAAPLLLRAYNDRDGADLAGYLAELHAVLVRAHALLAAHGSLYLHLDPRRGPYARVLLDEIFGGDCFVNQIVWAYALGGSSRQRYQRKHDVIYLYAKDPKRRRFVAPRESATSSLLKGKSKTATDVWETASDAPDAALLRDWPDELVRRTMSNRDPERTGYPTQKPLSLAARMVSASCPPGGLVVDPMAGSGTTVVAAAALGRRVIAGDLGGVALDVCRSRLLATGAPVSVATLDDALSARPWLGAPPVVRRGAVAVLSEAAPQPDQVAAWRRAAKAVEPPGAARCLWSGWGVGQGVDVSAWADAGPARTRAAASPAVDAAAADTTWWAVDVFGLLWTGPLQGPPT